MGAFGWTVVAVVLAGGGLLVYRAVKKKQAAERFAERAGIFASVGGTEIYRADVADAERRRAAGEKGPIPLAAPGGMFFTGATIVQGK